MQDEKPEFLDYKVGKTTPQNTSRISQALFREGA